MRGMSMTASNLHWDPNFPHPVVVFACQFRRMKHAKNSPFHKTWKDLWIQSYKGLPASLIINVKLGNIYFLAVKQTSQGSLVGLSRGKDLAFQGTILDTNG
jgi:hypothetical protein